MLVYVEKCPAYHQANITQTLELWDDLFQKNISAGDVVVLKPNWISHSHKYDPAEWASVITHPMIITAVLKLVLKYLDAQGKVIITDGPQTDSSWEKIMERMEPDLWIKMGEQAGVEVCIMDLRDDEWINEGDVIVSRKKLPGDPRGSTECDLNVFSEFVGHQISKKGYYGADYNKAETNEVHSKGHHKYRVSRTVMEADVFINLPKMKTHKKAGITCSLKNLVGINTYKNYLPHYNEGTFDEGGDQFPLSNVKSKAESFFVEKFKSFLHENPEKGKWFIPIKRVGNIIFGDTRQIIRSGNWFGNDTLWRMVLDLNKVLFYADPDGTLRKNDLKHIRKKYISIVDGIISGEGNGPEAPTPKKTGLLFAGANPVALDAVCAKFMGFDWQKIPTIQRAFAIQQYPLCNFNYQDIELVSSNPQYNKKIIDIASANLPQLNPHFGWKNFIELENEQY